jgi:O-antigen/teichoic acid export membrane protein
VSLRRNVIANYLGQGWSALMGIAFVPLYVAVLGVETYGLIGLFAVMQAWMALLDLGLTPTLNREMARLRAGAHSPESIRDLLRSLEMIYALLAVLLVVGVWFAAGWLAGGWLRVERLPLGLVTQSLQIMGLVLAARWLEQVYRGALQGIQDQVWLNVMQALIATLRWAGAYAVVMWIWPSVLGFFLWQAVVSLVANALLVHRTYGVLPRAGRRGRFDPTTLWEIRKFATGMLLGSFVSLLLTQGDKLVISKLLSLEQFGYYMMASTLAGGLLLLITPMNSAIYPRLTELVTHEDYPTLGKTYLEACQWMAAVIVPPALLLVFCSREILWLWTGQIQLADTSASLVSVLALGTLFNGLMNLPYMLQLAYGWTGLAIKTNAVAVVIMLPAMLWSIPRYGALGAAVAWLALNGSYLIVTAHLMHRRVLPQAKWAWYRWAVASPVLAAASVAGLLRWCLPHADTRMQAAVNVCVSGFGMCLALALVLPAVRARLRRLGATPRRPEQMPASRPSS